MVHLFHTWFIHFQTWVIYSHKLFNIWFFYESCVFMCDFFAWIISSHESFFHIFLGRFHFYQQTKTLQIFQIVFLTYLYVSHMITGECEVCDSSICLTCLYPGLSAKTFWTRCWALLYPRWRLAWRYTRVVHNRTGHLIKEHS